MITQDYSRINASIHQNPLFVFTTSFHCCTCINCHAVVGDFAVAGIHVKPDYAVNEIDLLTDVYDYATAEFGIDVGIRRPLQFLFSLKPFKAYFT